MNYLDALDILHTRLQPQSYVEIGCREGISLSRARCPSLAIDPDFEIRHELQSPTRVYKETSDAFFDHYDLTRLVGAPFDLAFIDGMHKAEFALRDFINLEQHAGRHSVIIIDDILPQDMSWVSRERQTQAWTGDVYKIIPLLRNVRPDLNIQVFDIEMKGMAIISNLSPYDRTLKSKYAEHERFLLSDAAELKSIADIRKALAPQPTDSFEAHIGSLRWSKREPLSRRKPNSDYLELLKRSLLNEIYLDDELRLLYLRDILEEKRAFNYAEYHDIRNSHRDAYNDLRASRRIGQFPERNIRRSGFSHTMMGRIRLDSLHETLDIIRENQVDGDLVECGVWRGGGCIFMAGYLRNYGDRDRRVFVADSFQGLPKPTHPEDGTMDLSEDKFPELAVSQETVQENFEAYDLMGDNIVFLKGWFKDTLKTASTDKIAILRLDGDLYESTMDILEALYDKVEPGGVVIVDDYGAIAACKKAIFDFFDSRNEAVPMIVRIDWTGVYWIKD